MRNIDENEVLRDVLAGLTEEVPPMPEGLHAAWMQQVEEDAMQTKSAQKTANRKRLTRYLSLAAAMVFVVGGTLLTRDDLMLGTMDGGSEKSNQAHAAYGALYDMNSNMAFHAATDEELAEDVTAYDMMMTSGAPAENGMAKMARTMETATEKNIIRTARVNSTTGLRTAYLTLRVPQNGLAAYLLDAGGLGRITSRSESATDVTESYQDTRARLDTQLALMARLQALITESADLSDLLALESQIADTQYQIDRLQSSLNSTDRQVTYATVDVTLREERDVDVTDATVSLGDRIKAAISLGWETLTGFLGDMAVFLVAAAPFIGIAALAYIAVRIVNKIRRK